MCDIETSKEEAKSPLRGCEYKPTMGCDAERKKKLEGGEGSASRPGRFTLGKDPVPIVQEAGWASGPVSTGAENLALHRDSIPGPSST